MTEIMDRALAYRNMLAAEDHILELLQEADIDDSLYLRGFLLELRSVRDRVMKPVEKDSRYHCLVKHLCTAYEACVEVAKATGDSNDEILVSIVDEMVREALERLSGRNITYCERCRSNGGLQEESTGSTSESDEHAVSRGDVQGISVYRQPSLFGSEDINSIGAEDFGDKLPDTED